MDKTITERIERFRSIMKLPSGLPIVTDRAIDDLVDMGFFTAPASTKYHGAYEGGLFDHSYNVTAALLELTKRLGLRWQIERSPYLVGMFHDLCKCDQYRHPVETMLYVGGERREATNEALWEYNPDTLLKGHGEKSIIQLSRFVMLTEEEIACIRYHMGAFTKEAEWSDYTRAIHAWPNVLWTHTADMVAAHIKEV